MNVDIWQNIFDGCIWNRRDGEIDKSRLYTKYILSTVVEKDVNYSTHTQVYNDTEDASCKLHFCRRQKFMIDI